MEGFSLQEVFEVLQKEGNVGGSWDKHLVHVRQQRRQLGSECGSFWPLADIAVLSFYAGGWAALHGKL